MSTTAFITITLLYQYTTLTSSDEIDDRDCLWYGQEYDVPIYPIGVCSTYFWEGSNDEIYVFSSRYDCDNDNQLWEHEFNSTNCLGSTVFSSQIKKEDGFYYNCESEYTCSYVKMKFYDLYSTNNTSIDNNDDECVIDPNNYEEYAIITNVCMDIGSSNSSDYNYIDCTSSSVLVSSYNNYECISNISSAAGGDGLINETLIIEGCDNPFDRNQYIQIKQCKDKNNIPTKNPTETPDNDNNKDDELAIIFTVIIAIIIIVVSVMIAYYIIQKKLNPDIKNANLKLNILNEPMHIDNDYDGLNDNDNDIDIDKQSGQREQKLFDRLDIDNDRYDTHQIITGGDDVDEIIVDNVVGDDDDN